MSRIPAPGPNYMSLGQYAKLFNVCYKTAYNRFHAGRIPGAFKSENDGHVYVPNDIINKHNHKDVVLYATAPSDSEEDIENMESDILSMTRYCSRRGWTVSKTVREIQREIVSGFRPKFNDLLSDSRIKRIVINKKADVCFYGYEYIKTLLNAMGRSITALDKSNEVSDKKQVMREVINTIYAACKIAAGDSRVSKVKIKQLISKMLMDSL